MASNGDVIKSRSVVRVIASRRWDAKIIEKTIGIPGSIIASQDGVELAEIEAQLDRHINRDADEVDVDVATAADERMKTLDRNVRITMKDLKDKYGFTHGCPDVLTWSVDMLGPTRITTLNADRGCTVSTTATIIRSGGL